VIVTECIRRAASLDNDNLRSIASNLDCNTFMVGFGLMPRAGNKQDIEYCSSPGRKGEK